ncbi:hypothetical protein H8E77_24475 [bacterium]|nr:hypothetical protein [bacterium]
MLVQQQQPKLRYITIVFLIIGLSFLSTVSVWGKPPKGGIGPEGGTVDVGHDSYLIIPAGALVEEVNITADSFDCAIPIDSAGIVAALNQALSLLDSQYAYIQQLPTTVDDSG